MSFQSIFTWCVHLEGARAEMSTTQACVHRGIEDQLSPSLRGIPVINPGHGSLSLGLAALLLSNCRADGTPSRGLASNIPSRKHPGPLIQECGRLIPHRHARHAPLSEYC